MIERAYAKVNLALEVLPTREDGYHDVVTIMLPVSLYDKLEFSIIDSGIEVESEINIKENSIYKAAALFFETYNINKGVKIKLTKRIPIAAGLAGGSSDAAATMRGLNRLFNVGASYKDLAKLCEKLGSDISYCVYSLPSICYGRGEKVKILNVKFDPIPITLIKFNFGVSTASVYKNYEYVKCDRKNNINNIIGGLKIRDINIINDNIFNDLAKTTYNINSNLKEIVDRIKSDGYVLHQSGSGPTHYILGENDFKNNYKKYKGVYAIDCFMFSKK